MSVARHHADWLSLLEISGPFVSMPVLMRVFPQGLDPRDPEQARRLRLAYEEWQSNPAGPGKQRGWVNQVLTVLLKFPADLIAEGQTLPAGLSAAMPEYGETLRPDLALVGPKGTDAAGKPQLLVSIYPPDQSLDRPVAGKHWKATAPTRMMELLHASDVALGLVTNGEQWMLVFAPRGETTGFTSWYGTLWIEEPITLRAFHSLLSISRFFGVAAPETLSALLNESVQDQQEVTNQLGDQVRDAVEVLIRAFDRLDEGSGRTLVKGVEEKSLYDAALTVMMRLVFLFSAEERGLLHLGKPIYDNNYAVSTLREQLQEVADRHGEELLERRFDAWARLLSTFRAVHGGVQHQDLLLPAYGGSLFDPDRYPFLEGRPQESDWRITLSEPLAINNRVVLHLLKSLQMLQVRIAGGGPAEARRISFRALDIEQIGHIYEGLLDHSAFRAEGTVLGLAGTRKNSTPNITLDELERLAEQGEAYLIDALNGLTGRSIPALKRFLASIIGQENHKILVACGQDEKLAKRVTRFAGLLREDSFERPVIVLPGGIYVSEGTGRRSTGTHYTPRSLTEPIVQHTLEPLVYSGPAEGLPKAQWELKTPQEILELKVCDMTMGSGAFLVQVCRYLSERLVESWEDVENAHPGELLITPEGLFSKGEPSERLIPKDPDERLVIARRLIADRCLYGVDINSMAVEMAKLSIWLITVDKTRPFTFLDHALKRGDSLLGISRLKQLEKFSLDDTKETQTIILSNYDELIDTAIAKRRELEVIPSNDAGQIASKDILNREADRLLSRLRLASDLLVAAGLADGNEQEKEVVRVGAHLSVIEHISEPLNVFRDFVNGRLNGRHPFHWPLEFPEAFERGGFDVFVGNPPFMGGQKISLNLAKDYRTYLIEHIAEGRRGSADFCAYFLLRAISLLKPTGTAGLIATNTISEGETRQVGLSQIAKWGADIFRAVSSQPWPGVASLAVSILWVVKAKWVGAIILDEHDVPSITPALSAGTAQAGTPMRLRQNKGKAFKGSSIQGAGFLLSPEEAESIIAIDSSYKKVIFPYLGGEDITRRSDASPSRWVINFFNFSLEEAGQFPICLDIVRKKVKPDRDRVASRNSIGKRRAKYWWRYDAQAVDLYKELSNLKYAWVAAQTAKYISIAKEPTDIVFSHTAVVFPTESYAVFAILNSSFHWSWIEEYCATLETRLRYIPTDGFETFPFPSGVLAAFKDGTASGRIPLLTELEDAGRQFDDARSLIMMRDGEGLTALYNQFHDSTVKSPEFNHLRQAHEELDRSVAAAYGWEDLDTAHGFRSTSQGLRYTFNDLSRQLVLSRLAALNCERYEEETLREAGLSNVRTQSSGKRPLKGAAHDKTVQSGLF
jgi:hypothetical protein